MNARPHRVEPISKEPPMRRIHCSLALLAVMLLPVSIAAQRVESGPKVVLGGVPFSVVLEGGPDESSWYEIRTVSGTLLGSGTVGRGATNTVTDLVVRSRSELPVEIEIGETTHALAVPYAPGWYAILPPLIAIALALVFKEVITSLFAGVWLGALAVAGYNPVSAVWRLIDSYVVPSLGDTDGGKTQIVIFSFLLGGMVGLVARNGGTLGIVDAVSPYARTPRRGKLATWAAGLAIFFDDYANTLIVGNTMRPITDRLKISREKLAYLVDSTAAPVAALVPISTWVGYEISLIGGGFDIAAAQQAANPEVAQALASVSPFAVFIQTIPYLFYPLLALAFVFLTSVMGRDFGPMARAEKRAATGGGLHRPGAMLATDTSGDLMEPKEGTPCRWWNAGIPVLTVVFVVLGGLYADGRGSTGADASLMDVFSAADPFAALLWGSLAGCIVALLLSIVQRILTLQEAIEAWVGGVRAMMIAMVVLVLAWSLGEVTKDLGTAQYLAQLLQGALPLGLLPLVVFVTAGAMAFATGTSWATMAILIPLVIPLTVTLGGGLGFGPGDAGYPLLLGTISSVLAGAIWGDHCSPISDTTVLSSMASGSDHVDHVRTQLPYAVAVALVAMLLGDLGTAYGLPNWVALVGGVAVLFLLLRVWGTPVDAPPDGTA